MNTPSERPADILEASKQFYWYHSIDLGGGVVTDGDYEMAQYLPYYGFPEDMTGMNVLDVGRGSGFFAFDFERRGANVTATELASFVDWDFVGGEPERARRIAAIGDVEAFTRYHMGAFTFAHEVKRSKIRSVAANIYNLSLHGLGVTRPYDFVFAGSVTSHLRDVLRGLAGLYAVTAPGGTCVVASPYNGTNEGLATLIMVTGDPDKRSWWNMNKTCLIESLQAVGFKSATIISEFVLVCGRDGFSYPHIVAHARR